MSSMRVQRALARAGVASRRKAEALISAGRVTVNGRVVTLGDSLDAEHDELRLDGRLVRQASAPVWLALHKPSGVMTTRSDPQGRSTVFGLVDDVPGLTYVGRLDFMTEGLLLLTTDGSAAHGLMHPSSEIERTYVAIVRGDAPAAALRAARHGVELDDGPVRPRGIKATSVGQGRYELEVTITEGRKREVRRMCKALGLTIERLIRVRFGPIVLGNLRPGKSRPLTGREVDAIHKLVQGTTVPG